MTKRAQFDLLGAPARAARLVQPRVPYEDVEQSNFVEWFRWQFPTVRILAIPNGAYLSGDYRARAAQMVRLKKMGLSPGAPDIQVPAWHLWIEFKRTVGGVLSKEQKEWHAYLREDVGDTVIVARGAEAAITKLRAFRGAV